MRNKFVTIGVFVLAALGVQPLASAGGGDMEWVAKNRGKPSAPVSIVIEGDKHHDAGQFVSLLVKVKTRGKLDSITITLRPTEGLTLEGKDVFQFSNPQQGEIIEIPVDLVASSDGRHRFRVLVNTQQNGAVRAKALGLPLVVGADVQVLKSARLVSTPEGERLHELPVIEEVNPDL